jgi:Fur family transcriptional regulator, ferric uptake regulator
VDRRRLIDEFKSYLREHNLPVTPHRVAVAEVLLLRDRHFSADEVKTALEEQGTAIGTATVYRALEVLVRSGLVVERDFGEGFRRFESARDMPHHEHVLCTVCGRVVEFQDERLERMTTLIAESKGYARQRHRLVIYGVCESCRGGRTPAARGARA